MTSTRQQIFDFDSFVDKLKRPNPPTPEAVEKAKFVDRTYRWNGR